MRPDEQYEIEIQVEPRTYLTNIIEALFTDTFSVNIRKHTEASVTFIGSGKKGFIYDRKKDLITLTGTYTANGTERYLMLGLFSGNAKFKHKYLDSPAESYRLKYIRVTPINHTLDCDTITMQELIYNENRRHHFSTNCSEFNTNLFPYLLNSEAQLAMEYTDPRMKKAAAYKKQAKPIDNVLRNLNFDTDDATLKPEAYKEVNRLVVIMYNNSQKKVNIIGYTDNTGSDERNMALSVARAKAVAEYLIRKGVKPERISYEGKGSADAIDSNETEEGRSNNRRVAFFLTD
jgi:outer membrane protein OmpA-like peptidoglycan-associated protein